MDMRFVLFLSRLLSFRSVALGLFTARLLKYFLFGIEAYGWHWNRTPTLAAHFDFIWQYCINPFGGIVIAAWIVDKLVGQVFFRQEVAELETILTR